MTTTKQTQKSPIPALLTAILDAWRMPDLRFRILFTLFDQLNIVTIKFIKVI